MKLSVFFISTVLTFLVAATPLVVPRAPSKPFKLLPIVFDFSQIFPALQVQSIDGTGFYRFGWFNAHAFQAQLYFPDGSDSASGVLDPRLVGFEIVLHLFSYSPAVYRVLLVDLASSEGTRFDPTRHFTIAGEHFRYDADNPEYQNWFSCKMDSDRVDLYFGHENGAPGFCESVKKFDLYPSFEGLGLPFKIGVEIN